MAREKNWDKPYAIEALTVHRDARGALYEALRFTSQDIPRADRFTSIPSLRAHAVATTSMATRANGLPALPAGCAC